MIVMIFEDIPVMPKYFSQVAIWKVVQLHSSPARDDCDDDGDDSDGDGELCQANHLSLTLLLHMVFAH